MINIVIVGGGTAGWLTALLISKNRPDINITSIDSSKISSIGVGEGTTSLFLDSLIQCGLDFDEIFKETHALPKYGINFINWNKNSKNFLSPIDGTYSFNSKVDLLLYHSILNDTNINYASRFGTLMEIKKTDLYIGKDNKLKSTFGNSALHLDTFKTIEFLKQKSIENKVLHKDCEIVDIKLDQLGNISALVSNQGEIITADLFIDCTGFSQVLIKKLNAAWIDYSKYLPVNTGMPFVLEHDNNEKNLYTTAHASDSGWVWEIPTRHRIGRGYVYSDQFAHEEDIIKELEERYRTGVSKGRSIKFQSGRLKEVWIKNCLSVGLSSAFLEPLQATSIHCSIIQIYDLILNCLGKTKDTSFSEEIINSYNQRIDKLYSHMADFISLHYSGGRIDTPFWNHVTTNLTRTQRTDQIINLAKQRLTRKIDFDIHEGYAGQWLWNYTLAGLDHFDKKTISDFFQIHRIKLDETDTTLSLYLNETKSKTMHTFSLKELDAYLKKQKEN